MFFAPPCTLYIMKAAALTATVAVPPYNQQLGPTVFFNVLFSPYSLSYLTDLRIARPAGFFLSLIRY